jgi:hypothetical protein
MGSQQNSLIGKEVRTPRAAAVAGILFSVLLITSQLLVWTVHSCQCRSDERDQSFKGSLACFEPVALCWDRFSLVHCCDT